MTVYIELVQSRSLLESAHLGPVEIDVGHPESVEIEVVERRAPRE